MHRTGAQNVRDLGKITSKISMELNVASSLHGNKITADKDLEKSLSEIRNITEPTLHACASHHIDQKIHVIHPCKDGIA